MRSLVNQGHCSSDDLVQIYPVILILIGAANVTMKDGPHTGLPISITILHEGTMSGILTTQLRIARK